MRTALTMSISSFVFVAASAFSGLASADVLPPNASGCSNGTAAAGTGCLTDDNEPGSCVAMTCSSPSPGTTSDAGDDDAATDASTDAGDAATDASSDAASDAASDASTVGSTHSCSVCVASTASCATEGIACVGLTAGATCALGDSSTGVCTAIQCSNVSLLACEHALGATDGGKTTTDGGTTGPANGACAVAHTSVCTGAKVGDGCDFGGGLSGNCGNVSCGDGTSAFACVAGKGSTDGGCEIGSADLTSTIAVLGLLAPFVAIRRKKNKANAKKDADKTV